MQQYRLHCTPCPSSQQCPLDAVEETKDYLLGFIEFDDQGWLWNPNQLQAVMERLQKEESTNSNGLVIVLYAHGWKHNVSAADGDVKMFRGILEGMQAMEYDLNPKHPRKVAGVCLGWRGKSLKTPVIWNLSFWDRKRTANVVGQGAVAEILARLDRIRLQSRVQHRERIARGERLPTMFVVTGHSFGTIVLYSALASLIQERLVNIKEGSAAEPVADLVAFVNPAFEAARLQPLKRSAERNAVTNRMVTLALCTSKKDFATKYAFPVGRFFSTLVREHRDWDQRSANITAVGHYDSFTTHELKLKKAPQDRNMSVQTKESIKGSADSVRGVYSHSRTRGKKLPPGEEISFSDTLLTPIPTTNHVGSIFVISVGKKIIPDHGTIDTPEFQTFIREFIMAFAAPTAENGPMSVPLKQD